MQYYQDSSILGMAVHKVGNKINDEALILSDREVRFDEEVQSLLLTYFFHPFKTDEYFHLSGETGAAFNDVYVQVSRIFDVFGTPEPGQEEQQVSSYSSPELMKALYDASVELAKILYERCESPKIKPGEFYVTYIKDCLVEGEKVDAVGLFKSENKDTFIKIYPSVDNFKIEAEQGLNLNKLDKGCLIFNMDRESGYKVAVVDNAKSAAESLYWSDDFLNISQCKDDYYNTENVLTLCKHFVTDELPQQFTVSKADQADLLNKSVQFFKENDDFEMERFAKDVLDQQEVIQSFEKYKKSFEKDQEIEIADSFGISDSAVKKQSKAFKGVIKLDKNFHIYVHGNGRLIEKGYDENKDLHFYQLYFKQEE